MATRSWEWNWQMIDEFYGGQGEAKGSSYLVQVM
jgi:hypothetical protein